MIPIYPMQALLPSVPQARERTAAPRHPELWSACQDFEALLTQQLLKAMTSTLSTGSFFGEATGSSIYQGMYETEMAKAMSRSGGIGIAEILYKQMSRQLSLENSED